MRSIAPGIANLLNIWKQRSRSVEVPDRLPQLDALRGIAATTIVFRHLRLSFTMSAPRWFEVPAFAGYPAIVLFFVLSGYVLSLRYWKGSQYSYGSYVVQRLCRVYLPFLVAAVLSIAGAALFNDVHPPLTSWFAQTWRTPVTVASVGRQLMMWHMQDFNTAFWSLRYEMQLSLLMPLFFLAIRRRKAPWITAAITAAIGLTIYSRPEILRLFSWHYLDRTLQFAFLFLLGMTLARYRAQLQKIFSMLGHGQWLMLVASLFLFYGYPASLLTQGTLRTHLLLPREEVLCGLGACGILLCALHLKPVARLLSHPLLEDLGRISYSLFLVHGIVLFAMLDLFYGQASRPLIIAAILASSFAAAYVFWFTVEQPCTLLGKMLAIPGVSSVFPHGTRRKALKLA